MMEEEEMVDDEHQEEGREEEEGGAELEKLESCCVPSSQIAQELQEAAQTDVICSSSGVPNGVSSHESPMLSPVSSSMSASDSNALTSSTNPGTLLTTSLIQSSTTTGRTQSISQYISDKDSDELVTTEPQAKTGQIESPVIPRNDGFSLSSPASAEPTASSLFGWFAGSSFVSKVVEKTKSSVESMITTLDPQMKEYMKTGGEINIVVASAKEVKIGSIREAMQQAFGCATVTGRASDSNAASQPVGFPAAMRSANERISRLRKSEEIPDKQTICAIEGFIVELQPDSWYEMSCLLLDDPLNQISLNTFSQPTPIPTAYVLTAQDRTPSDYPLRWSGLAVTIGQVVEGAQPHIGRADWHQALTGVSRKESLAMAAKMLAYLYKQQFPTSYIS